MTPGIVDLRDLTRRDAWTPRALAAFVAATGIAVGSREASRRFAPPRVLVVIVRRMEPADLRRYREWLAAATHVVIVRDGRGDPELDADVAELLESEWEAERAGAAMFDWRGDDDGAACGAAVRRAVALAAALGPEELVPPPAVTPDRELATSGWFDAAPGVNLAALAALLDARDGEVTVTVADGSRVPLEPAPHAVTLAAPPMSADRSVGRLALGRDPVHPVGWRGLRMAFRWLIGDDGGGALSANDHDWPCGPAKKLYRSYNNDPVQICVTPAADAYAARFDHDVLVTTSVPIAWTAAALPDGTAVDLALFSPDPQRAVFFVHVSVDDGGYPATDLFDEDARARAPALVLGPAGYALGLDGEVQRIMRTATSDGVVVHVGGPAEGYAIFDREHRLVRRGAGRLLGGWYRWLTLEYADAYWREDLVTGERYRLAPVDLARCVDPGAESVASDAAAEGNHDRAAEVRRAHASGPRAKADALNVVAIPGTRNVLLVGATSLRVL